VLLPQEDLNGPNNYRDPYFCHLTFGACARRMANTGHCVVFDQNSKKEDGIPIFFARAHIVEKTVNG